MEDWRMTIEELRELRSTPEGRAILQAEIAKRWSEEERIRLTEGILRCIYHPPISKQSGQLAESIPAKQRRTRQGK